ncbi:hypothetical protein OG717_02100 [Streptomyces celluloflavus]|nr:hypothetical protein OG717_02100 [Streptomyces celluloflavus]
MIFHAIPVCQVDRAVLAVADVPGKGVAGLPDAELLAHLPPVGVIDRVDDLEQVQGLGDAPAFGERLPQRGRLARAAEHPQQVPVLTTEGRVTLIDGLLGAAVLLGLLLNTALGWWWADPAAGYPLVCCTIREVREIFSSEYRTPNAEHRPTA